MSDRRVAFAGATAARSAFAGAAFGDVLCSFEFDGAEAALDEAALAGTVIGGT